MNPSALIKFFLGFVNQLRFRNLFLIVIILLVVDLLVPDFIPLIDEIILGLIAIILANWKKKRKQHEIDHGRVIEGEIIEETKESSSQNNEKE